MSLHCRNRLEVLTDVHPQPASIADPRGNRGSDRLATRDHSLFPTFLGPVCSCETNWRTPASPLVASRLSNSSPEHTSRNTATVISAITSAERMRLLERLEVPERPPSRKEEINCEPATYSAGADPQSSTA